MSERMWKMMAGEGSYAIDDFEKKSVVAIGWKDLGDLTKLAGKQEIGEKLRDKYPGEKEGYYVTTENQLNKFIAEIAINDYMVLYNRSRKQYLIGKVISDAAYDPTVIEDFPTYRKVKWLGNVDKFKVSKQTRNSLGAILTLFEIYDASKKELLDLLGGANPVAEILKTQQPVIDDDREDTIGRAKGLIIEKLLELDWDEMQDLIAGLLRAMGLKTKVSKRGPDQGKDIVASPDGLGLQEPRVKVEVKHRLGSAIGAPEIRSFLGGLRSKANCKGLYISTGGFSREAKLEADRADIPITLIDIDDLTELVTRYYDSFDNDARALIPLTKVYWPV
jgi:restriction system protein